MKKEYSAAIAAVINDYLTRDDWSFSFDEEIGIFKFNLSVKGKIQQISYFIDVKESEYIVYAISPIGADIRDKGMMANMAEFICRANYNLRMGNFEFDCSDGEIRFKVDVCCDGILPTLDMVRKSI